MFSSGRFLYVGFIFPGHRSALCTLQVIAAWSGAPACPLAPGPCKQMATDAGEKGRSKQEWQPSPALLPCPQSLQVCVPTAMPGDCLDPETLTDTHTFFPTC